jgi:hypothetical protein
MALAIALLRIPALLGGLRPIPSLAAKRRGVRCRVRQAGIAVLRVAIGALGFHLLEATVTVLLGRAGIREDNPIIMIRVLEEAFRHDAIAARGGIAAQSEILLVDLVRGSAQPHAGPVAVVRLVATTTPTAAAMMRFAVISSSSPSHVLVMAVTRPHQSVHPYPQTLW